MTDRDRLIELMSHKQQYGIATEEPPEAIYTIENHQVADYLLANGVIVPPCKVWDMVYEIQPIRQRVQSYESQKCNCCIHDEVCSKKERYVEGKDKIVTVANNYSFGLEVSIKCKYFYAKAGTRGNTNDDR